MGNPCRFLLLLVLAVFLPLAAYPQQPPPKAAQQPRAPEPQQGAINVERSPQLFAVLCALYAAGFESDVALLNPHPLHQRLRQEMALLQGPAVETLRTFFRQHRTADPAVTLSRYVSFALVVGPPPRFDYQLTLEQLPPDVRTLDGFTPVLAAFYQEAGIEVRWRQIAPQYDQEIRRLELALSEMVFLTTGYLREALDRDSPRQFTVYVEPLVGAKTNLRNYGDHYAVAVNPAQPYPMDDIRHGFLHFVLDPLAYRYRPSVERLRPLLQMARRAPRLPAEYLEEFPAYVVECLVRAVDLRLHHLPQAQEIETLDAADADGYVLVRSFYARLTEFEAAAPAMSYYFADLLRGISITRETARLEKVQFAPALESSAALSENVVTISETERLLLEAEAMLADRNSPREALARASALFQQALEREPGSTRAVYGAAFTAAITGDVERAKTLFQQVVSVGAAARGADASRLAWSHVYLGRIYGREGKRELALTEYRAALAVENAPETARAAARKALESSGNPPDSKSQSP